MFVPIFMVCAVVQLKYPSALISFEKITNYAKGKRIALFLDYDGTLSPIVNDPDSAFMSNAVSQSFTSDSIISYLVSALVISMVFPYISITINCDLSDACCCAGCCRLLSNSYN